MAATAALTPDALIHRVDLPTKSLAGWSVRYRRGGRKFHFLLQDKDFGGEALAYDAAKDLVDRIPSDRDEALSLSRKLLVRKSSKSGVPGVTRYVQKGKRSVFWLAYWTDAQGRKRMKKYRVNQLGEDAARAMAIAKRESEMTWCSARLREILIAHQQLAARFRGHPETI